MYIDMMGYTDMMGCEIEIEAFLLVCGCLLDGRVSKVINMCMKESYQIKWICLLYPRASYKL